MPSLDHHIMMKLKLERWSHGHPPRGFEIEREIMADRHRSKSIGRKKTGRFSLGTLKMLWRRTA